MRLSWWGILVYRSYYDGLYPYYLQYIGGKLDLRYLKIFGDQMDVLRIFFLSPRISLISLVLVGPIWELEVSQSCLGHVHQRKPLADPF